MARVRLRLGDREIEVDSRDFYVDNQTLGGVVDELARRLPAAGGAGAAPALGLLENAEVFEPEFCEPRRVGAAEIPQKLRELEAGGFFDSPRTASEAVEQLRERGWAAGPLDVSKALARMATGREVTRHPGGAGARYSAVQKLAV